MSLVPYHPLEDREIVLRHNNALVVRNRSSQRLEIQRVTECPTCHQPLQSHNQSAERDRDRQFDSPGTHDSFVSPNYFRLLQAGHDGERDERDVAGPSVVRPPSSPVRRLTHHQTPRVDFEPEDGAEFVSSSPHIPAGRDGQEGARIRKSAFSRNYFRDFFTEERELGRGGKGVVLLVRHQLDGVPLGLYACKRVPVGDDHAWLEKVLVEVELLATLTHPNLVAYRHVWLEEVKLNRFGPAVPCAFILQQYCNGGDLLQYVVGAQPKEATKEELKAKMRRRSKGHAERPQGLSPGQRRLPLEEIFSIFKDITSGLVFLHTNNYIHRDLKPSNCLIHRQGKTMSCLISDFGEVQQAKAMRKSTGSTGTISYCAPEVLVQDSTGRYGNFTTKSDIFSLGMILYFLCFGRLPYRSANMVQEELEDIEMLRAEIADWKGFHDERRERPDLPSKVYHLLKKLLSTNPAERPSASEVLSVMKTESSPDGIPRGPRSGSPSSLGLGLSGRRIQNLDSPLAPATPVIDPVKRSYGAASSSSSTRDSAAAGGSDGIGGDEGSHSPLPTAQTTILKSLPSPTRYRPPAMTASRSHDGHSRSSPSPAHDDVDSDGLPAALPSPTVPLLMAPPSTPLEQARHQVVVAWHHTARFLARNSALLAFFVRLAVFTVKMDSLARPCWPFMANLGVGAPLVAIAGMDLGIPATAGAAVSFSDGTRRGSNGGNRGGAASRASPHVAAVGAGGRGDAGMVASRWKWDWRVSAALLALHFLVLWAASRRGKLCATAHGFADSWSHHI